MQDVSILGCQGKKAIGKEVLLALEIAILKSSFFHTFFQSPNSLWVKSYSEEKALGLEMSCLIFTKSLLMR